MTTIGMDGSEFKDPGAGFAGEDEPGGRADAGGQGLVLPEAVVADLAGQLVARARAGEPVALTGRDGLLSGLIGQVLQAGLGLEPGDHLAAGQEANGRNGYRAKTLKTEAGPVMLAVPQDRAGTFEPVLAGKGERRTSGISGTVTSLYAAGLSVRDIARHCQRTMGIEVSRDTISRITDECLEDMRAWQSRPLEAVYPVTYVDALVAKVRDGSSVRNKAVNIAVGIDCEGEKHVLGIWVAPAEGAKAWGQAFAQLRNRGLQGAPDPGGPQVRLLYRPQGPVRGDAADLHRARHGRRRGRAAGVRRQRAGGKVPGRGQRAGAGVGPVRAVPGVRAADPESDLHHECHRVVQPADAEDHQDQRPFPER